MKIKRYFGKTSREALLLVRQELGANAVILANRAIDGGNEILAFKEEDMAMLVAGSTRQGAAPPPAEALGPAAAPAAPVPQRETPRAVAPAAARGTPLSMLAHLKQQAAVRAALAPPPPARQPKRLTPDSTASQPAMTAMLNELRSMRGVIESQLTEIAWHSIQQRAPAKAELLQALIIAGFSAGLARQLAEKLPDGLGREEAMQWVHTVLTRNLPTLASEDEILERGGVFALVGPTGVGKTTTTAKLAAHFAMKHGTSKLALITTDSYRIGGHEQLRIYGKILGVMVHSVKDQADLRIALEELKNKHTILIDTVGVSQRDQMVAEQIAMLSGAGSKIRKLLCLNATSTGETLADVVHAYRGHGLDGCIVTKLDEAATLGSTLDIIIREKLKLHYITNGQRVPEDIHLASNKLLVHRAFSLRRARSKLFQFRADELPFLMASTRLQPAAAMEASHA